MLLISQAEGFGLNRRDMGVDLQLEPDVHLGTGSTGRFAG